MCQLSTDYSGDFFLTSMHFSKILSHTNKVQNFVAEVYQKEKYLQWFVLRVEKH